MCNTCLVFLTQGRWKTLIQEGAAPCSSAEYPFCWNMKSWDSLCTPVNAQVRQVLAAGRNWMDLFEIINALATVFTMTQCLYDLGFTKHLKVLLSSVFHLPNVATFYFWEAVVPFNLGCFPRRRTCSLPLKLRSVWDWWWAVGLLLGLKVIHSLSQSLHPL